MSEPNATPAVRSWSRNSWLIGVLLGAIVLGLSGILVIGQRPQALPRSAASLLVPRDAFRYEADFTEQRKIVPSTVESSRMDAKSVALNVAVPAYRRIQPPDAGDQVPHWWREATISGDPTLPSRLRIRIVDSAGVWFRLQQWGELGLSLDQLLELPSDVGPGRSWSSSGKAIAKPLDRLLTFRNTSTARRPVDQSRASAGCLTVDSSTTLTAVNSPGGPADVWQEQSLWCPGQGVVDSTGSWRAASYAVHQTAQRPPVQPRFLHDDPLDLSRTDRWTSRESTITSHDNTFGDEPAPLVAVDSVRVAANGMVTFVQGGDELTGLSPLTTGNFWWDWWVRPGGSVVTNTTIGSLAVVATTRRELVAYATGGRWRWTAALPDVAVAPPIRVDDSRLAAATVDGTILMLDATTGRRLWSTRLSRSVHDRLATDGSLLVAVDTGPSLTALDPTTGDTRWQVEATSDLGSVLLVSDGVVVEAAAGLVTARSAANGDVIWRRKGGSDLSSLSQHGDQLWLSLDGAVRSWSLRTGRELWRVPAAAISADDGAGCEATPTRHLGFVLQGAVVLALDERGRAVRSWPVPDLPRSVRTVSCSRGRVWVTSYAAAGDHDLTISSVGPPS